MRACAGMCERVRAYVRVCVCVCVCARACVCVCVCDLFNYIGIFLVAINVINAKLCIIVVLIELVPFIPLTVILVFKLFLSLLLLLLLLLLLQCSFMPADTTHFVFLCCLCGGCKCVRSFIGVNVSKKVANGHILLMGNHCVFCNDVINTACALDCLP